MSRTPEQKFVLLFEAVKRSLLSAEILHQRLATDLAALESDLNGGVEIGERAVSPLLSAVSFVDFAHRFASLVDSLPLIKKSAPELRQLKAVIAPVEIARNHLQHMRGDLSSNEEIKYPILGSLAWTTGNAAFTIAFTQPTDLEHFSIAYNSFNNRWTAKHRFSVKDAWVDLDPILAEMHRVFAWITGKVQFNDPEFGQLKWGATQAFAFRMSTTIGKAIPQKILTDVASEATVLNSLEDGEAR
jgi:hypothetical protein